MSTYSKTPKVEKHPNVYEIDGGGFYVKIKGQTKTFAKLADAIDWRDRTKIAMSDGTHQQDTGHTLSTYFEKVWLPSLLVRKATRERYDRSMRKHVIPVLGDRKLESIIGPDLDDLVLDLLAKGMEPSTVTTTINPLKTLLTYAVKRRVLRVNEGKLMDGDILKVERKKQKVKPVKAMDEAQLRAWFEHVAPEYRLMFEVLLGIGCRPSELLGMTWDQVGPDSILIDKRWASQETNDPKNGTVRSIPISKGLSNKLSAFRMDLEGPKTGLVFPNPRGSHWSDITLSRRALDPVRKATGMTWVTFYTFRHTFCTRAYRHGVPLGDIADMMGHADPTFTWKVYRSVLETERASMDWQDDLDPSTHQYTSSDEPQSQSHARHGSLLERG